MKLNAVQKTILRILAGDTEMSALEIELKRKILRPWWKFFSSTPYADLYRLESKGLIATRWIDDTTGQRGGCQARLYRITDTGKDALEGRWTH